MYIFSFHVKLGCCNENINKQEPIVILLRKLKGHKTLNLWSGRVRREQTTSLHFFQPKFETTHSMREARLIFFLM